MVLEANVLFRFTNKAYKRASESDQALNLRLFWHKSPDPRTKQCSSRWAGHFSLFKKPVFNFIIEQQNRNFHKFLCSITNDFGMSLSRHKLKFTVCEWNTLPLPLNFRQVSIVRQPNKQINHFFVNAFVFLKVFRCQKYY